MRKARVVFFWRMMPWMSIAASSFWRSSSLACWSSRRPLRWRRRSWRQLALLCSAVGAGCGGARRARLGGQRRLPWRRQCGSSARSGRAGPSGGGRPSWGRGRVARRAPRPRRRPFRRSPRRPRRGLRRPRAARSGPSPRRRRGPIDFHADHHRRTRRTSRPKRPAASTDARRGQQEPRRRPPPPRRGAD